MTDRRPPRAEYGEETEEDTSDPTGQTDLSYAANRVYLVKMPEFLLDQFSSPAPTSAPIGRLLIPKEDSKKMARIYMDNPPSREATRAPPLTREYELHVRNDTPKIYVFSGDPEEEEGKMKVEGQVSVMCVARPKLDEGYRRINRMRVQQASRPERETMYMDEKGRRAAELVALKPVSGMETAKEREERKRKQEQSKRHLDIPEDVWRESAKKQVFQAFNTRAYWTADALSKHISEPLSRLRSIINEICVYNKSGPFNGRYELRDEFKTVEQRQKKAEDMAEYMKNQKELARKRKEERAELGSLPKLKKPRYSDD